MTSIPGLAKSDSEVIFEMLLDAIQDTPRQLQMMIDSIVVMQESMPMPEEGWEQFVRDIEYTNQKHGWSLQVLKMEG